MWLLELNHKSFVYSFMGIWMIVWPRLYSGVTDLLHVDLHFIMTSYKWRAGLAVDIT